MGIPYHIKVHIPQLFTVSNHEVHVDFLMEINNWFQNPNLYDFDVYGEAIMGNASAQQAISNNGTDVFSIGQIY